MIYNSSWDNVKVANRISNSSHARINTRYVYRLSIESPNVIEITLILIYDLANELYLPWSAVLSQFVFGLLLDFYYIDPQN